MRAASPEDSVQLLLVAETSGQPTEDSSGSALGDGRASGVIVIFREKVWRELDLTLKNRVWKLPSGLLQNIPHQQSSRGSTQISAGKIIYTLEQVITTAQDRKSVV